MRRGLKGRCVCVSMAMEVENVWSCPLPRGSRTCCWSQGFFDAPMYSPECGVSKVSILALGPGPPDSVRFVVSVSGRRLPKTVAHESRGSLNIIVRIRVDSLDFSRLKHTPAQYHTSSDGLIVLGLVRLRAGALAPHRDTGWSRESWAVWGTMGYVAIHFGANGQSHFCGCRGR